MVWSVAVALALQDSPPPMPRVAATLPAHAILDSVAAAELRFFHYWNNAWRVSELARTSIAERADSAKPRNQHAHCHSGNDPRPSQIVGRPSPNAGFSWAVRPGSLIRARGGGYAVCPTWAFRDEGLADERIDSDAGLLDRYRPLVTEARRQVMRVMESAADLLPRDAWLIGQRIRFLVDAQDADEALRLAEQCDADISWCAALAGYVLVARDEHIRADSAFAVALGALDKENRCRWTDFSVLLDSAVRGSYSGASCMGRDSLNARIWWLADPLWSEAGNERRAEAFARKVNVALRRGLDRDERHDWRQRAGGSALEEMIVRYGWPSYLYWGGPDADGSHSGYLKARESPINEPYSTFEYSLGRQRLLPEWKTIREPLKAESGDWQINAPDSVYADGYTILKWWPAEHYAAPFPLAQLVDGQIALLRRQTEVLLATSTDVKQSGLARALSATIAGALVITERPDTIAIVAHTTTTMSAPLILFGPIPARPALIGIEVAPGGAGARNAARTRHAIAPPAPLSSMHAGEVAVSEPVILQPPPGSDRLPNVTDAALRLMAPSTVLPRDRRIGIYWESYGFRSTDTVDVAVWIERYTSQGLLRDFSNALRVTRDLNTPIAISWREPDPGRSARLIGGPVPIVARSVVIDASGLLRGSYWLEVAIGKPNQPPVRARRSFIVQ